MYKGCIFCLFQMAEPIQNLLKWPKFSERKVTATHLQGYLRGGLSLELGLKVNSHQAVNGNVNINGNLRFSLRFRKVFHTKTFLLYLYFSVKTAAVNVNLHLQFHFLHSVKASTVLNHSKLTFPSPLTAQYELTFIAQKPAKMSHVNQTTGEQN